MKKEVGRQKMIKENNQKIILDYLFNNGSSSRAELSKKLKLSAPSISKNISDLIEKKILLEIGEGNSLGGRRPTIVQFNYNYGYIISINFGGEYIKIVLGNLKSKIIEIKEIHIAEYCNGKTLINKCIDTIDDILKKNRINFEKLFCIAIGFPAVIDEKTDGISLHRQWFNIWDEIDIKEEIQKKFVKSKIIIKNDINMAALGELRYGKGRKQDNLIYISVDMGVGAGIIINKRLYEGSRASAGEIGYSLINIGDIRHKGKSLESTISISALVNRIKQEIKNGQESKINKLTNRDIDKIDIDILEEAIRKKDEYMLNIMEEVVKTLGFIISNVCILLDIELIIIGGRLVKIGYDLLGGLNKITSNTVPQKTQIVYASLESNEVIYGGFACAVDYVMENILMI